MRGCERIALSVLETKSGAGEDDAFGLFGLGHLDGDLHAQFVAGSAEIGAGQRRRLGRIARDRDPDEILAADEPIGRVELDPSRARQIDLAPGVRRPAAQTDRLVVAACGT